ncbi:hypothetical protein [Tumebacillus algifaecis]|nr:hypothetical protein [Tumebacillus algifaecis]
MKKQATESLNLYDMTRTSDAPLELKMAIMSFIDREENKLEVSGA